MRVLILLAVGLAAVVAVPEKQQRIVGGSETTIDQYPYTVALLYSTDLVSYFQECGGTILNSKSILTAAHCTIGDPANRWRGRVGSSFRGVGGIVHGIETIINHPSYNPRTTDHDISLVRTFGNINYDSSVRSASIAGSNYNLADNQVVWAVGWGKVTVGGPNSEQLRHVQIWTINQDTCRSRYAEASATITDNMLCSGWLDVGGRDQCQGDSGGPLIHNNVVVGVCSWGIGCADARFPGVNARVSRYTSWILANA